MNATAKLIVSSLLITQSVFLFAQELSAPLSAQQKNLQQLEASVPAVKERQLKVAQQLEAYQRKLKAAEDDLAKANEDAALAELELQKSNQAYRNQSNQDTQRALRKAEHGFAMAERGVKNRQKRVERIQGKQQQLSLEYEQLRQKTVAVANELKRKRADLAQAIAQEKALKQANEQRQAAKAEQEKIQYLRTQQLALLEQQKLEKQQQAQKTQAPKTQAPKTQAKKQPVKEQLLSGPRSSQQAADGVSTQQTLASLKASALSRSDQKAQAEAQSMLKKINEQIEEKQGRRALYKRLALKIMGQEPKAFEFMGANYYRAEMPVESGEYIIEVAKNRFKREFPEADHGESYVFIYQAKSSSRGKLMMYKKSLVAQ